MRALGSVVIALLTAVALAGCSSSSEPATAATTSAPAGTSGPAATSGAPGSTSASPGSTSASPGTTSPGSPSAPNRAPTADIVLTVASGQVPFNATFKLSGADADKDPLTWTFDANGDGKSEKSGTEKDLPTDVKFSYTAKGNYTAKLSVADGKNTTVVSKKVTVTAGATQTEQPGTEYECTVDVPAVVLSVGGLPVVVGECAFTETTYRSVLVKAEPATGCTIRLDEDTSDTSSGAVADEGKSYPPGQYTMRCNAPDNVDGGTGKISIRRA